MTTTATYPDTTSGPTDTAIVGTAPHGATQRRPRPADLAGVHALVTGGGRGLGRAVARTFAEAGAHVSLLARSGDELAESVALIEDAGGIAASAPADVRDPDALGAAIARLRRRLGPVDVLVNGAGIVGPIGPLWEVDAREWWATMEVNLAGLVLCTQLVLPEMVARRRGRILNISSQAGVRRWPLVSAYSVSKAAVTKLSENLAREVDRFGITVLSVHPGLLPLGMGIAPDLPPSAPPHPHEDHIWAWVDQELTEGRGADPADAVDLIVRLAAGDGDALSGRHVSVHDDLDALLADVDEVRRRDLGVLKVERLRT
jgi:NAD(P)-dependent dehydrogenase (short-subunit alcohol dehydrogenase family)